MPICTFSISPQALTRQIRFAISSMGRVFNRATSPYPEHPSPPSNSLSYVSRWCPYMLTVFVLSAFPLVPSSGLVAWALVRLLLCQHHCSLLPMRYVPICMTLTASLISRLCVCVCVLLDCVPAPISIFSSQSYTQGFPLSSSLSRSRRYTPWYNKPPNARR